MADAAAVEHHAVLGVHCAEDCERRRHHLQVTRPALEGHRRTSLRWITTMMMMMITLRLRRPTTTSTSSHSLMTRSCLLFMCVSVLCPPPDEEVLEEYHHHLGEHFQEAKDENPSILLSLSLSVCLPPASNRYAFGRELLLLLRLIAHAEEPRAASGRGADVRQRRRRRRHYQPTPSFSDAPAVPLLSPARDMSLCQADAPPRGLKKKEEKENDNNKLLLGKKFPGQGQRRPNITSPRIGRGWDGPVW